jgi:hypothetical protein
MVSEGLHRMLVTCKKKPKLQTVNLGLKLFARNKNEKIETPYRLVQEGLEILLPFMDGYSRQYRVTTEFFLELTSKKDYQLSFVQIEEKFGQALASKFKSQKLGSAVLQFQTAKQQLLSVTGWIGVNNVSLMLNKEEITSYLFLI